ncbi:MAG: phosphopyruvate hydratase [Candidatus Moraniibacteriota bacterium]|nr:MAG: phosphopyruvate hydratase [Candidatus Moranbacteria bacterium]
MPNIASINAREILDSRGYPTVEVTITLDDATQAVAAVPSGASTGSHEALELRDGDSQRYLGKGVLKAVANVQEILAPALVGMDVTMQRVIDEKMIALDGTKNKSKLGANAILGVSLAVARAAAQCTQQPLFQYLRKLGSFHTTKQGFPVPMFNVINGGEHADSGLSVQEFKIVPSGISGYHEQLRAGSEVFHTLERLLKKSGYATSVGDEGGFAPKLESHTQAFEFIVQAIQEAGYTPGKDIVLDIDAAANSFYDAAHDRYLLQPENVILNSTELASLYQDWTQRFPLRSIEDPFQEEDWQGWQAFQKKMGSHFILVGDDLLVTNVERVQKAIDEASCNAVLIKVNQIGTLSETIDCILLAQKHNFQTIISHRSGETTDDFIADLAVAVGAQYIKTGSLSRGERLAKYNRLLTLQQMLSV